MFEKEKPQTCCNSSLTGLLFFQQSVHRLRSYPPLWVRASRPFGNYWGWGNRGYASPYRSSRSLLSGPIPLLNSWPRTNLESVRPAISMESAKKSEWRLGYLPEFFVQTPGFLRLVPRQKKVGWTQDTAKSFFGSLNNVVKIHPHRWKKTINLNLACLLQVLNIGGESLRKFTL